MENGDTYDESFRCHRVSPLDDVGAGALCRVRHVGGLLRGDSKSNFNPRTHVECDFYGYEGSSYADDFNPRTRVECDLHRYGIWQNQDIISIHALI
ncbi:hypothetical protein P4475_05725 [Halalkalibacterium halodurans]|uniref:hypothetical protein n=1 Tax=Halalkalibacterium halodurans TaxID=86665 RepID=UPI002E1C316D|nr:hypothetical protein [Halalkalibacterium halodurans]